MKRALFLLLLPMLSSGSAFPQSPAPPETRRERVVDTIHGVEVEDPYRWLEDQTSPETRAWVDAQNAYAESVLGETPLRKRLRARFGALLRFDEVGSPRKGGSFEYFTLRRTGDEIAAIYRRPAPPEGELSRVEPEEDFELVVDPSGMSPDQTTKVDLVSVSTDGRLVLYSVREGGADEIEIRVRNAGDGVDLPDRLPRALYSGISFSGDGQGFYYTYRSRQTGPRARFHRLGTNVEEDVELFGEGLSPRSFLETSELGEDGKTLLFTVNHGWARSDLHVKEGSAPARVLIEGVDARFYPQFHEGLLYVRTNLDAPRNRVVAIDLAKPARGNWREIVPETEDVLTGFSILDGKIYATVLENVSARIRVYRLDGGAEGEIAIPPLHSAELRGAGKGKAFLTLSSLTVPQITYLLDLSTGERTLWEERKLDFDPEGLVVRQVFYPSKDGTRIPMHLLYREGIERDGSHPTLLFGYGGFNVALTPRFDPVAAAWVAEGGVFAMAHLRGGSEYGEAWHRAGMLENKQNVFDDFIAGAEYLIRERYTRSDRLAIRGISNGGLLVASATTQRPDLFGAVLCGFPDLDMVRFVRFRETNNQPALLEYGDASIPEQFSFLRKYSPYQAVREETPYPAVMLTSGDLDTRVPPLQARKMAARLQGATSSGRPVILRYHEKAGHAADYGMPVSMRVEDLAAELAFLLSQLGAGGS
jgi:prolyl oligopeptidase